MLNSQVAKIALFGTTLLLIISVVAGILWWVLFPCHPAERAVLKEFAHYGEREAGEELKISGNELGRFILGPANTTGGCLLQYSANASPGEVRGYYEEQLVEEGWQVRSFPAKIRGDFEYPHLEAHRDGFRYTVHYWRPSEGAGVTEVRVDAYQAPGA